MTGEYAGRRVGILGLGREGSAVARVLSAEGAQVTVVDRRPLESLRAELDLLSDVSIHQVLGEEDWETILSCETLVLSPGVDKGSPLVREALRRGLRTTSETRLFFERCPAPIIGVTGSSGKTTTTSLLGAMLQRGVQKVFVGGNIGEPLLPRLGEITETSLVVLELSSFQLEWLEHSPHIAAVTNITPNHLDRHKTMEAYVAAKRRIMVSQESDDIAILNGDDQGAASLAGLARGRLLYCSLSRLNDEWEGGTLDENHLVVRLNGLESSIATVDDIAVPGRHNIMNVLFAATMARVCGIEPEEIRTAIRDFRGVSHRLQRVAVIGGVVFYDDSIATAPERTLAALEALEAPIVLILGGRDKGLPWDRLARFAVERCRGVVLLGEAGEEIKRHLLSACRAVPSATLGEDALIRVFSMEEAVHVAVRLARTGDVVLLAPGCTSYDMYHDFAARGDHFVRVVEGLRSGT